MRKILIPLLAVAALSACETVKGAGEDLQAAGQAVSRGAAEAKASM